MTLTAAPELVDQLQGISWDAQVIEARLDALAVVVDAPGIQALISSVASAQFAMAHTLDVIDGLLEGCRL